MRIRPFLAVAVLIAAVPAVPAQENPGKKTQPPAIVLRIKSIEGILSDARYLAKLADQEEQFKQGEELLKTFSGESGLGGIDMKRPFALYGDISPGFQDSPVVLLIPIADEKAFVDFLGSVNVKAEKGKDGVYTIDNIPNVPIPVTVYFRFAHKYAYITVQEKANLDEKKLLKPEAVLPAAGDKSLASLSLRLDGLPDIVKQIALGQIENQLAGAKENNPPNESPAMKKIRHAMIDLVTEKIKSLLTDGEEMSINFGVDEKKEDISANFSFRAKKGSKLAKDMESVGRASSLFSALASDNTALRVIGAIALPAEIRNLLGPAIDDAIKDVIGKETDPNKIKLMKTVFDAVVPTLKAGELDAGLAMVGPDKDGHFTMVGGAKVVKGKEIDAAIREVYNAIPEGERKNLILDATTIGEAKVHKVVIPDADDDAKKLFGELTAYVAISGDAVVVAAGPDALKVLKQVLTATPKTGAALVQFDLAVGKAMSLDKKNPKSAETAKEVFKGSGDDHVTITVEAGETIKVTVNAKAKIVALGAKMNKDK